ncbi:MAG TPA: hypothetical protein VMS89_02670 [Methanoregulaceae archaeon]|nr:hypothetical protein [Methanoregulaceae archaeon]
MKTVMITKAGYLKRAGFAAIDDEGSPQEIVELRIYETKFAIRLKELRDAMERHQIARVEKIFQNWQQYLGGIAGLVRLSRSGRALLIEMIDGGRFTVPVDAVYSALCRRESFAPVGELPEPMAGWLGRGRRLAEGQQRIPVGIV